MAAARGPRPRAPRSAPRPSFRPALRMSLIGHWHRFHQRPRRVRWPAKSLAFGLVVLVVLFPKVWLLPRYISRLADINALLDPASPGLAPLEERVRCDAPPDAPPATLGAAVERVVCARLPYAFDWDVWSVADYWPTVDEALAQGRADCGGRAVVAASLLRRMGYAAWLTTDLKHVWVVTPEAELMGPGEGAKTLVGTETGTRARLSLDTLANVGRGLSYGIAVFPLTREIAILAALGALSVQPRSSVARRIAGWVLLVGALGLLRFAGPSPTGWAEHPALVYVGVVLAAAGWFALVLPRPVPGGLVAHQPGAPPTAEPGGSSSR